MLHLEVMRLFCLSVGLKKLMALITVLSVLFITYGSISMFKLSPKLNPVPVSAQIYGHNLSLFDVSMSGKLNLDIWKCRQYVGFNVDDMRIQKDWPLHPNERSVSYGLRHTFKTYSNYAVKMYGYLLTHTAGFYSFQIISQSTAALSVELWMSTSSLPSSVSKLAVLEYPDWNREYFSKWKSIDTLPLELESGQVYYLELHMKSFDGHGVVEVKWWLPEEKDFVSIPSHSLAMAVKLEGPSFSLERSNMHAVELVSEALPSNQLQTHDYKPFVTDTVYNITRLNVLPECTFESAFAVPQVVKPYKAVHMVLESWVYPGDPTYMYIKPGKNGDRNRGNLRIPKKNANRISKLYSSAFLQSAHSGKVVGVRYMEETRNKDKGSRFLLEMDVLQQGELVHTSEYVYLPLHSTRLCHTSNFQWQQDVDVHLVVSVKNLGPWVRHLIQNVEQIFAATGDMNFQLIIVDFMSTDLDIAAELNSSRIPRWKLLTVDEVFSRSQGLQVGIDCVEDNNSIVMTIDMHLTLPPNFIDAVRKHTVQGKMAYTPMFFRLDAGYTEINTVGMWEILTYGLFGMYKSDWLEHGGFNVQRYTNKWGGEDWDVLDRAIAKGYEVFRTRPPGLVHYYHSRAGMWDSKKNTNMIC